MASQSNNQPAGQCTVTRQHFPFLELNTQTLIALQMCQLSMRSEWSSEQVSNRRQEEKGPTKDGGTAREWQWPCGSLSEPRKRQTEEEATGRGTCGGMRPNHRSNKWGRGQAGAPPTHSLCAQRGCLWPTLPIPV